MEATGNERGEKNDSRQGVVAMMEQVGRNGSNLSEARAMRLAEKGLASARARQGGRN
jgi:hypothetical protein